MNMKNSIVAAICAIAFCSTAIADEDVDELVGAVLRDTPIIRGLQELTDRIGGRVTDSASNLAAADWALANFAEAEQSTVPFAASFRQES